MAKPEHTTVYISASGKDAYWRSLVVSALDSSDLEVLYDTYATPTDEWNPDFKDMREAARIAVLLVSQNFLDSKRIRSEELPHLFHLRNTKGLQLLPVIIGQSTWQAIPELREIQGFFPEDGVPLQRGMEARTHIQIQKLAEKIVKLADSLDRAADTNPTTASLAPPILVKTFGASNISLNETTTLRFTITNPNPNARLTGIAFTDFLPEGLVISKPNGLKGSLADGQLTAPPETDFINLIDAVLPASGSCSFQLNVSGTSPGTKNNITRNIFSMESGVGGAASASITVTAVSLETPSVVQTKRDRDWITNATLSQFSEQVRTIIYRAETLRTNRKKKWIHTEDMLLSLEAQPDGQFSRLLAAEKINLKSIIKGLPDDFTETSSESAPVSNTILPPISPFVRRALAIARDKAHESGLEVIEESHLLFGVLSTNHRAVVALNNLGIKPNRVVLPSKISEPGPEMDRLDSPSSIATYQSEDWNGPDLLNIRRDVNALASLVAGWNVQPPLSIGLFGEWGSGKSFFMRQMRKRVKQLALAAQKSAKPQRECAYYKNIVQIEFNAWHYMEGNNLWACLVQHIFSNLGLPQDTTDAQIEKRQRHILEQIGAKKSLETQAAERRKEMEIKRSEAERRAVKARTELDTKGIALEQEKSALWDKVKSQLSQEVESILRAIPETAQLSDSVETVRRFSQDAKTLRGRAALLWNLFRHDPQRRKILYWMLGGSVTVFGLVRLFHLAAPTIEVLIQPAFQALIPIASAIAVTATKFRAVLKKIGGVVSFFEEKNQEITQAIANAEKVQKQQIAKLEDEVRTITQNIDQAEKEEHEHRDSIVALEKELAATDANTLLAEFIQSRAAADDYRKHLGIVALVRRDFERLSDLFQFQRKAELAGTEHLDDNTVNRIILYIDDLDRCPPQTVVDVLQAVHLLLAFPIFVVVVAVDSRWVSRSLERCYEWLVPGNPSAPFSRVKRNNTERHEHGLGATAHDYLEKIFQIPFWLAPMESEACQIMIRGLTEALSQDQTRLMNAIKRASTDQPPANPDAVPTEPGIAKSVPPTMVPNALTPVPFASLGDTASMPPTPRQSVSGGIAIHTVSAETEAAEGIELSPRQLDIEEVELKKIDDLTTLIGRSPRVAKRFLNCYRLIKARLDGTQLGEFLSGRFEDVMDVLAVVVGAPSAARIVLTTLSTADSGQGKTLVEKLTANLGPAASTKEGTEIIRLLGSASTARLESLRNVVPLVSRFSFETHSERQVLPKS